MSLFLDPITITAQSLGDLQPGTFFILESSLLPKGGVLPPPPVVMRCHDGWNNWSRALTPPPGAQGEPTSGHLDPKERVIIVQ